jgi:dipeptide transport system ATP-binding protein
MYAGQQVEEQPAEGLFAAPRHPYTAALLDALPERSAAKSRLATIPGMVPGIEDRPRGCLFNPRCRYATDFCVQQQPALESDAAGRRVRCHYPLNGGQPGEAAHAGGPPARPAAQPAAGGRA